MFRVWAGKPSTQPGVRGGSLEEVMVLNRYHWFQGTDTTQHRVSLKGRFL